MYKGIQLRIASVYKQTTGGLIVQINKNKPIEFQTAENNGGNFKLQRHSERIFDDTQMLLQINEDWIYDSRRGFYTNSLTMDVKIFTLRCDFRNERGVNMQLYYKVTVAGR